MKPQKNFSSRGCYTKGKTAAELLDIRALFVETAFKSRVTFLITEQAYSGMT
jgi:hypothetical protein